MSRDYTIAPQIPKSILVAINQLYEIDQKIKNYGDPGNLGRNAARIKDAFFDEYGLRYEDPMGQSFKESRTDLEASISGAGTEDLVVVEVIKPIICVILHDGERQFSRVVQNGVVVVESRKES